MLNIESTTQTYHYSLWHLGFRPFFIAAALFAVVSMLLWMMMSHLAQTPLAISISPSIWHSHEMVYGYSMAVIAGFLLTAVYNWTGVLTLNGKALAILVLLWFFARLMPFIDHAASVWLMATFDLVFMVGLLLSVLYPVVKVRQWKQLGIVSILLLITIGNGLFYLSLLDLIKLPISFSIYLGFYIVISLILLMSRRVIPFFIEKGVDESIQIRNWLWLDVILMLLFIVFVLSQLELIPIKFTSSLATGLLVLNLVRLWQWYTPGIWRKPLLWILYLAYACLVFGFALFAIASVSPFIALHAFAVGGVGVMTLGMMSRVALGHTGRNVFEPPRVLIPIFGLIVFAFISRVVLPLITIQYYNHWLFISQVIWILAFMLFSWVYVPMLYKPRVDGRYG